MIWSTIKKHGLLFWRNHSHMQLLIGLPLILIAILGFSLQGFMSGDVTTSFQVKVALVEHENEETQINQFIQELNDQGLPPEHIQELKNKAVSFAPIGMFKEIVSDQLDGAVTIDRVDPSEKSAVLENDEYAALIEVPKGFTVQTLKQAFLNEAQEEQAQLHIIKNEDNQQKAQMVVDLFKTYKEQLARSIYIQKLDLNQDMLTAGMGSAIGAAQSIGHAEPISAKTYYAIGMVTMNMLFVATSIAMWAYHERENHIFNRMIISDTTRRQYVLGIFAAGSLYALLQALVIFGISVLLFKVYWPDIGLFMFVTGTLALSVGGLAALLSAVSYQLDSLAVTSLFSSFVIYMFAFLGGSFFPVSDVAEIIGKMGNLTPNGAGMTAYLTIMRGGDLMDILPYASALGIAALVLLIAALAVFPKRGAHI
ncbi:hypothetical protein JNUCC1_00473 [Lentibacillus sp. JNUCC-1]|uniref:ABC transporter permease n=1 Tax=Lentibacillus sp. JNUCC-1 TaxID=2654513 RepID=UPI0012E810A7|nr:ABC transporter permease [Lentibacillus sp. JNUCC-1]MUV36669.1 hypothetical protein [Lentibacillus sp. JNUCC-1]